MLVDNISMLINEVSLGVDTATLSINEIAVLVFVQDGVANGVHFEVTQDVLDVELGEGEDLWYLVLLQSLLLKDDLAVFINNISLAIH
jgi:hypothetical protein